MLDQDHWFKAFCIALNLKGNTAVEALLIFNRELGNSNSGLWRVSDRLINNWKRAKRSPLPSRRTAEFLLAFLQDYEFESDGEHLSEIVSFLEERSGIELEQKNAFPDPYSFALQREIPIASLSSKLRSDIQGFHRLIRYNSYENTIVTDVLKLTASRRKVEVELYSETGSLFRGFCYIIDNKAYFTLVGTKSRYDTRGMSVRQLMFEIPVGYNTDTLSGIMTRTTSAEGRPISSLVLLDKITDGELLGVLHRMTIESLDALKRKQIQILRSKNLIGTLSRANRMFGRYKQTLIDHSGEYITPIRPIDLPKIYKLFVEDEI